MAEGKKSFVLYCEWKELFSKLKDEQAGRLIKHIFSYVTDENPEPPDEITDLVFIQIKHQFKRDLRKYENIVERNKANGSKGGRPKTNETQNNPLGYLVTQIKPENPKKEEGRMKNDEGGMMKVDDINPKKDLEKRKEEFALQISPLINENFERAEAKKFYDYWTEKNRTGRKMRFEMEKTFEVSKRVATWINRNKDFKKPSDGRRNGSDIFREIMSGAGVEQDNKFLE